jgi:hypothetical protein
MRRRDEGFGWFYEVHVRVAACILRAARRMNGTDSTMSCIF